MELRFKGSKKKVGNSFHVTIPKAIANILEEKKEYCFVIKESEKDAENL